MKLYKKSERSTFSYWFAHWKAFNLTAMLLGVWQFRFLFHDIEKPFLMWMWKDYQRVKKYHRTHARHHFAYEGDKGYDYLGMVIDWECSRFSKADAQMNAIETYDYELHKYIDAGNMKIVKELQLNIFPIIVNLNLVKTDKDIKDLYANIKPIETN